MINYNFLGSSNVAVRIEAVSALANLAVNGNIVMYSFDFIYSSYLCSNEIAFSLRFLLFNVT